MDAEDLSDLLRRALAGDRLAQDRLVAVLTPVIHTQATRTMLFYGVRNVRQEVEDRTQDVLLSLFAKGERVLRSWKPDRGLSLQNFVRLVTKCQVISHLRRYNSWREEPTPPEKLDVRVDAPGPVPGLIAEQELELFLARLRKSVSALGWLMFQLLFLQELSVPEAMAASGMSRAAVYAWRSRLRRLIRKLRKEMSETPPPGRNPP